MISTSRLEPRPARSVLTSIVDEEDRRALQTSFDRLHEGRSVPAVDYAMIEGRRKVHHLSYCDLAAMDDRPFDDFVHADDCDFRRIENWRGDDPAQRSKAGYGDGRARQLVARGLSVAR